MLEQIYQIMKILNESVSNIVVMGTGEPLDNYDNLVKFLRMISDDKGINISARNITVSTCGIVPMMKKFANEKLPVTLALSLHGATQEKRCALMPIAKKYPLEEVIAACDYYFQITGRRITFEYSFVNGVNDTDEDVQNLSALIKGRCAHVNLIPVNEIAERNYKRPFTKNILKFQNKLEKNGINVTIRREMGSDIDGACGQLRLKSDT